METGGGRQGANASCEGDYPPLDMGASARERATEFAREQSPYFEVVEKPPPKRERARLDAIASLPKQD
jgi:hypothetical protein